MVAGPRPHRKPGILELAKASPGKTVEADGSEYS